MLSVSVIHVLWECPAYGSCRLVFEEASGDKFSDFSNPRKTSYVLGSELCAEKNFSYFAYCSYRVYSWLVGAQDIKQGCMSWPPAWLLGVRIVSLEMVGMARRVCWAIPLMWLMHAHVLIIVNVCVYVMGAWSMAMLLWQLFEYYIFWGNILRLNVLAPCVYIWSLQIKNKPPCALSFRDPKNFAHKATVALFFGNFSILTIIATLPFSE